MKGGRSERTERWNGPCKCAQSGSVSDNRKKALRTAMMQGSEGDGRNDGPSSAQDRRLSQRHERSGDYSADGRFDPNAVFDVVASTDSAEQATSAMRRFIDEGNADALRQAIAIYTRSARARGKGIENVLAELNVLSGQQRGRYALAGRLLEPTALKRLVLEAVLEGFRADGSADQPS